MVKEKVKKGKHLTVTTSADGSVSLAWDWGALLAEVNAATTVYKDLRMVHGEEAALSNTKKDIVKETETKVKATRTAAKKPAAKKATKKKETK